MDNTLLRITSHPFLDFCALEWDSGPHNHPDVSLTMSLDIGIRTLSWAHPTENCLVICQTHECWWCFTVKLSSSSCFLQSWTTARSTASPLLFTSVTVMSLALTLWPWRPTDPHLRSLASPYRWAAFLFICPRIKGFGKVRVVGKWSRAEVCQFVFKYRKDSG